MTESEKKKAFDRARREVLKKGAAIQRDTANEIIRLLKLAHGRIRETLLQQPTEYEQWRLPQLQTEMERRLAEFERSASRAAIEGVASAHQAGRDLVDAPLSAAGLSVGGIGVDPRALDAMALFTTNRIKGLTLSAIDKLNTELGLVILGAQTPGDAIGKVRKILGDDMRQRAITIVRTEVGGAFSAANQKRMEEAKATVPGLKKLWRRSGKRHSRPGHDALDGEVREIDEPWEVITPQGEIVELLFPRDPKAPPGERINCGCESLPFMDSWTSVQREVPFSEHELSARELARNPVKAAFKAKQRRL